jgi:hypothetical protein
MYFCGTSRTFINRMIELMFGQIQTLPVTGQGDGGNTQLPLDLTITNGSFESLLRQGYFFTGQQWRDFQSRHFLSFRDGDERTARCFAESLLSRGGYVLPGKDEGMTALIAGVGSFTIEQDDSEHWLHSHARKI